MPKELIKRCLTGIILLLTFIVILFNKLLFWSAVLFLSVLFFKEYIFLSSNINKNNNENKFFFNSIIILGCLYFVGLYFYSNLILPICIFLLFIYSIIIYLFNKKLKNIFWNLKEALFAFVYCFVFPSGFCLLQKKNNGLIWIIYIVTTIITSDIFAYICGKFFGKHFIIPKISNKKTLEGFIGSIFFGTLVGFFFSFFILQKSIHFSIIISFFLVITGILGDLFESYFKREAKIKDSGTILPGHGGVLDRFDSLIFSAGFIYLILFYLKI